MLEEEPEVIFSSLQQTYIEGDKSIDIEIYRLPDTGWTLEVVDEYGNSSVWNDEFATDQDALDEAMRTIHEEGIDSLIGKPPPQSSLQIDEDPLTNEEIILLDNFLASGNLVETAMDFAALEGFITAIVVGPRLVHVSDWIPWIWDMDNARNAPDFSGKQDAMQITSLILRHYKAVVSAFDIAPESFEPIFCVESPWSAVEWCMGFMIGLQFASKEWRSLLVAQPAWFTPFIRLGTDKGFDITDDQGDTEKLINEIKPSLLKIHGFWSQYEKLNPMDDDQEPGMTPIVRIGPKIGRNDPRPCGSGRKFKKCCGPGSA